MSIVNKLLADAGLVARPVKTQVVTRTLIIGPDEARALLAANADNRKLRPGRVEFYASTMKQGGWRLTHQGIAFGANGRGIDLQHRLNAVIASGVVIEMMVTENLSDDAFEAIDQHERRSISDALRIERELAECARFFLSFALNNQKNNPTILEVGETAGAIGFLHAQVVAATPTKRAIFSSVAMRSAAITLISERPYKSAQVLANYRSMVLTKTEDWSPAMHAFNRQCTNGSINTKVSSGRIDLFARALIALDPTKSQFTKIQIGETTISDAKERIAQVIEVDVDFPVQSKPMPLTKKTCADNECCYFGQPAAKSCGCSK